MTVSVAITFPLILSPTTGTTILPPSSATCAIRSSVFSQFSPLPGPVRVRSSALPSNLSPILNMDNVTAPSLYPLQRCKTIHLVRHAQGVHNIEGDKNYKAYMSPEYFDAPLTPLGWQQVDNLRKHVHACGLSKRIELVVTSPLLRTMQTAVGVFGGEGYTTGMNMLPLMVANAGNSDRSAISSLDSPPIIAVELCREHLGVHPCDRRRNIQDYQFLFPAIDFSLIENDEDVLWKADVREAKAEVAARGMKFMNWLVNSGFILLHQADINPKYALSPSLSCFQICGNYFLTLLAKLQPPHPSSLLPIYSSCPKILAFQAKSNHK